jgi:ATP-dependent helicase YprA (DUF1998 family)
MTELTQEEFDRLVDEGVAEAVASRMTTIIETISKPYKQQLARSQEVFDSIRTIAAGLSNAERDLIETELNRLR